MDPVVCDACGGQVFKLLAPHLSDVAALNTVYRRCVLDPVKGVAQSLALGDRNRGLCVKFVSERLHAMSLSMFDPRQSFSKLGPYAAALYGMRRHSATSLNGVNRGLDKITVRVLASQAEAIVDR